MFEDCFDGTPGGNWTWEDIEAYGAPEPEYWQLGAFEALAGLILSDARIASIADAYFAVENPSQQVTNAVTNVVTTFLTENASTGMFDGWVDQFIYVSEQAQAWKDANGFANPYLSWGSGGRGYAYTDGGAKNEWVAEMGGLY